MADITKETILNAMKQLREMPSYGYDENIGNLKSQPLPREDFYLELPKRGTGDNNG